VIEPQFGEYTRASFVEDGGGKPVPDRFSYGSDNNAEWLDDRALLEILERHAN
jgi:UDP-N-acetylglucosamine 4,6-dehydratase